MNFFSRRLGGVFPCVTPRFFYRWRTLNPHLLYREVQKLIPSLELKKCLKL
jgi:hypothetical protein